MKLPMLYKRSPKGKVLQWEIAVSGAWLTTTFGQLNGKLQRSSETILEGKNLGKSNATTPEQQAELEAAARWKKQIDKKGYRENLDAEDTRAGLDCMLAHSFGTVDNGVFAPDQAAKIAYPAFVQPKLDGHRARLDQDGVLWSRGRKPLNVAVPHIIESLRTAFPAVAPLLDGELYAHGLRDDFETLSSICRQTKQPHPEHKVMQYWVYDVELPGVPFVERLAWLEENLRNIPYVTVVLSHVVHTQEEALKFYAHYRDGGYEGTMIRNAASLYKGGRSYDLQKLKGFRDSEFSIVGIKEGRGKLAGHAATFTCVTDAGGEFEVKLKGSLDFLKQCWYDHSLWQGKSITVRYQSVGDYGVPRIPVGLRLREEL